jgi:hypothetical protein
MPDDYAAMILALNSFPFIFCEQVLNRFTNSVIPMTHGSYYYQWLIRVNICLAKSPTVLSVLYELQEKQRTWAMAMNKLLVQNRGIGGTVFYMGNNNLLFNSRIGNIGFDKGIVFWGLSYEIPVVEDFSQQ